MPSREGRTHAPAPSLRDVFRSDSVPAARLRVDARQPIYATGDEDDAMYLVESGRVKIFMSSESGRDCLLAIYTAGDVFGESCFASAVKRPESASAMNRAVVRRLSRRDFLHEVRRSQLTDELLRHLAARIGEGQGMILDLVTSDSERRLAKMLLNLAEKLGTPDGPYVRVEQRISHEDLSQMVGTTRPRVTAFLQNFKRMGMIDTPGPRSIRVHRQRVREFLGLD